MLKYRTVELNMSYETLAFMKNINSTGKMCALTSELWRVHKRRKIAAYDQARTHILIIMYRYVRTYTTIQWANYLRNYFEQKHMI